jgi:DNA-binding MarR family transcriptional regulator
MNYVLVQFAEAKQPEYREKKGEGYIQYGDRNDYPNYLVELFNKSAKHNAIVRNKVHYITGNGWTGTAEGFIQQPNRSESLDDLTRKVSMDMELFGGAFIEVIWGIGKVSEIWHCDYTKFRTNKDNTQFWYKEDWKDRNEKYEVYPAFNPKNPQGKQILYLKEYRPNGGVYTLPSYFGALNYIESDIEVSKHVLGNAKTGFSASKLITLPNGEPSPEEQRVVHNKFKNTYTGADGIKYMLAFVNDASRKPIVDDLGQSDLTKEDFGQVDQLIQTNIFSGHQVTTPSIFGIAVAGQLGTRTEMRDGYEIFKNTYVNGKQMFLESAFNMLAGYAGYPEDLKIIPTEPIGIEFSEATIANVAPKEWIIEKLGIDMSKYQPQPEVNPEVNTAQFSDQFQVFFEFGQDKSEYNIWKTKHLFGDVELFADVTQLQSNVLDLIAKDKRITPEVIAETLKEDVGAVKRVIDRLEKNGYIKSSEQIQGEGIDSNVIIVRELTEPLADIVKKIKPETTEFLIRYSYEWKKSIPSGQRDTAAHPSREFCKYLLQANKFYSRSEIEQMSARLGYSVWDRRGGWWTQPNGQHSPSCRHEWVSNIVTRK